MLGRPTLFLVYTLDTTRSRSRIFFSSALRSKDLRRQLRKRLHDSRKTQHGQLTMDNHSVRATSYSYEEWRSRSYQNSEPPQSTFTKFCMSNYVGDVTPHAKIQIDRPNEGVPANGWCITVAWFLVFLFFFLFLYCDPKFCSLPEPKPEDRFLRYLIHRMSIPRYCISIGKNSKSYRFLTFLP